MCIKLLCIEFAWNGFIYCKTYQLWVYWYDTKIEISLNYKINHDGTVSETYLENNKF